MKKITTMAYVAALALVSTAGLTSCKSDEPVGNYSGETVKTQFAISLPNEATAGISGMNRMAGSAAQVDGINDFQGIVGVTLIPFAKQTASITSGDTRLGSNIILPDSVKKADLGTNSKAKVYKDVSIPLSTASFLFYAKSAQLPLENPSASNKFAAGSLIPANLTANTPASITFSLEQIKSDAMSLYGSSAEGDLLMQYLTSIAIAEDSESKAWYAYTDGDNAALKAMFDTYKSMKGLSSFEVERVLTDLNKSLKPLDDGVGNLPHAIRVAIANGTYATVNASDEVALVSTLNNFPEQYNLPVGSFDMQWNGTTHKFEVGGFSNMAHPDAYVFPAQLWYYANSLIKTSNTSKQTMYDNSNNWAAILAAHTDAAAVNTRTRAVAITNVIQYAVARLDVSVKLANSKLVDNSESVVGVKTDVVVPGGGFPVTAVLVGGQQQVKFDFTTNGGPEYTIYDKDIPAGMTAINGSYSTTNYTMVLENGTGDVNVAVEMQNNSGVDFYGHGGQLIPKGGKFYVIAQLSADAATETGKHVFKQDFKTIAKLTLQNLKYAYNTIPDLRTPQLELGFSVDLSWQDGHEYEIDFETDPVVP